MELQKIKNLLDHKNENYSKYQTKKWYIINDRNNRQYGEGNLNDNTIKIDTEVVKPFLCDYADAYILATGSYILVTVVCGTINTKLAFKNCHPFIKCKIHLNDTHVEDSNNLHLIMNMYNLIEYSDNYEDSAGSLYHFKRQEPFANNIDLTVDDSSSFKYKSNILGKPNNLNNNGTATAWGNAIWQNAQIIVLLKYISSFFRSLELTLINNKLYIKLNYITNSVISDTDGASSFKITKAELYDPVVTLKTEDNNKLNQLLDTEFKRTVYWNEYKSEIETITQAHKDDNYKRSLLDAAIPGVNKLFVAGFNGNDPIGPGNSELLNSINTAAYRVQRDSHRKYVLPRVDINDYNVLIYGRNFYDQNDFDDFKKYQELRKVMTGREEDYTTGSLLDYEYWKNNFKLICCDLSKPKVLDSNPNANQQIEFVYKLDNNRNGTGTKAQILTILEKRKRNKLRI